MTTSKDTSIDNDVELPIKNLFVDNVEDQIFVGGIRVKQPGSAGYQRDPHKREKWLTKRGTKFDAALCRPVEVAVVENFDKGLLSTTALSGVDGKFYAILDGGGRWLMAQIAGIDKLSCRVHNGLSRKKCALLFSEFDSEVQGVTAVDQFLAKLAAGVEEDNEIADAIVPYEVGVSSTKKLDCVGALRTLWRENHGLALIAKTAKIVFNTWGGGGDDERKPVHVPGNMFSAVAILLDQKPRGFDEGILREALMEPPDVTKDFYGNSPKGLTAMAKLNCPGIKLTTNQIGIVAAKYLMLDYNKRANRSRAQSGPNAYAGENFKPNKIDDSIISKAIERRFSFKRGNAHDVKSKSKSKSKKSAAHATA